MNYETCEVATESAIGYPLFKMLTGRQIRSGRALLGWSQRELASNSGVSYSTIVRAEGVDDVPSLRAPHLFAIQKALENAKVVFIGDGEASSGGGPGVRLRD